MSKIIIMMQDTDYCIYPYYDIFSQNDITVLKRKEYCPVEKRSLFCKAFHWLRQSNYARLIPEWACRPFYKKYIPIPNTDEKIFFWFWGFYIVASKDFRQYLKKHFPNCKIIQTLFDLVKWHLPETNNFKKVYDFADAIFSYDIDDVKNYGLNFHRDAYSVLPPEMLKSDYKAHDLNFCGLAKDRYDRILSVYDEAKKHGIDCDFNIPRLPEKVLKERPEFLSSRYIPYLDYLKMIQSANCLLEISQGTSKGYSLRPWEAIAYGKKILSDNKDLLKEEFYDPRFIQVYEKVEDIDWNWVKERIPVDYKYIEKLSVKKYVRDILNIVDNPQNNNLK